MIDRELLFGNDIQVLERAGGFDAIAGGDGDLRMARGTDDIIQALTLRLLVRLGALAPLGWPDYGSRLHELIGEPNNRRTHLKLMAFARAALELDARVDQVADIQAEIAPGERNAARLTITVALIQQPTPVTLVFLANLEAQ